MVHFSICRGTALGTGPCHKRVTYRWNQSMQCQCLKNLIVSALKCALTERKAPGDSSKPTHIFLCFPIFPRIYVYNYIYTHNVPDVHHYITCQISYIIHMGARCRFLLVAIPHGIVPPHNGTVILPTGAFFCYTHQKDRHTAQPHSGFSIREWFCRVPSTT